ACSSEYQGAQGRRRTRPREGPDPEPTYRKCTGV
ncbi:hypothetical protein A0H81_15003, partial [Grifola frondosa]